VAETAAARGQVTRQRLLAAAVALIGEVGWNAVTTRLVAERAGVAPGVVHYHFSSVTELLTAAALGFAHGLSEQFAVGLAAQDDLAEGLEWLLGELSAYGGGDPASLLMVEMYLASTRLPALRTQLTALVRGFRNDLAAWVAERGYDGDADALAALLAALLDGLILHHHLDPGLDLAALSSPLRAMLGREKR
jgi:AcrR family transcriptional regulator